MSWRRAWVSLTASAVFVVFFVPGATPAVAAGGPSVHGGGVVDGPLGVTSQLGFTASERGGSFLCVMAGRSGGFRFADWDEVHQMHVQGSVTPGTLEIDGAWSRFEGVADIHVVGVADGQILRATVTDVAFVSTQVAGGAEEATHLLELELPGLSLEIGPAEMKSGRITVHD